MKKIALAVLLASGLMAADNGVYVGLDIGKTDYSMEASAQGISEDTSVDFTSYTFKTGYYLDANNRVYASYQYIDIDETDAGIYSVGYDYLIGATNATKPFIGAFVGYGTIEDNEMGMDLSGAVFGAQIGVKIALNDNFSLETGFRYMKTNMDDSMNIYGVDVDLEVDDVKNLFFGMNYKF